jgi:signal transduction histidine kinase
MSEGWWRWRNRRITTVLTVSVAMLTLFTIAFLTTRDVVRQRQMFREELQGKGELLARTLNDILANALYFDDIQKLRLLTDVLKANPDVRDLVVFDASGRILVGPGTGKYPTGGVDGQTLALAMGGGPATVRSSGDRLEVVKGIEVGVEVLGGMRFSFDTAVVDAAVAATIREHLRDGLLSMVLAVGLSFLIARSLVGPVQELTAVTRRIAAGELAASMEPRRGDEIGDLAEAMHEMSQSLQRVERERAEERAAVLREANEQLRTEVEHREQAQRAAERFNVELSRTLAELNEAHAEREMLIRELRDRNEEMERFTYAASHDLKSPLITIRGFLGYVEKDVEQGDLERMKEDVANIHKAIEKMEALLDDILQLSRTGRLVPTSQEVGLTELAREAVTLVGGPIRERGVEVAVAPDMPVVVGDRARLVDMLQNLVENAVKFMGEQSHPRIEIGAREEDGEAVCYVRDNGVGIDPEYHEEIFGLFVRLEAGADGSGIGLGLAQRIVELYGGRIWVESEGEGRGSTFCFTLPGHDRADAPSSLGGRSRT